MRVPKPWYRKSTRSWFVQLDGRQVPLGRDKQEAHRKYHSLMAGRRNGHSIGRVDELFVECAEWACDRAAAGTERQRRLQYARPARVDEVPGDHAESQRRGVLARRKADS